MPKADAVLEADPQNRDDGCAFDHDLAEFESNMNIETLHIGMKVRHPQYGVLDQKVNASDKLSEADKFDLKQYITRCYGSLTTFHILVKSKDDQFRTSG